MVKVIVQSEVIKHGLVVNVNAGDMHGWKTENIYAHSAFKQHTVVMRWSGLDPNLTHLKLTDFHV